MSISQQDFPRRAPGTEYTLTQVRELLVFLGTQTHNVSDQVMNLVEALCVLLGGKLGKTPKAAREFINEAITFYPDWGDTTEYYDQQPSNTTPKEGAHNVN